MNILPLPKALDENEWFILLGLMITIPIIVLLPKRMPISLSIIMLMFGSIIARVLDHLLSSPTFNLYDVMDTGKYDFFDILTYLFYAPFSYFFVYFYERFHIRGFGVLFYIVACSIAGTLFEGISVYFNVFTYKGWGLIYSFSVYLVVQSLTILLYRYIKFIYLNLSRK
jgi:hypothetical protein